MVDTAYGDVFTKSAIEQRKALGDEIIHGFGADDEHGLVGSAMKFGIGAKVAVEAVYGGVDFWKGAFGDTASGDIDLDD